MKEREGGEKRQVLSSERERKALNVIRLKLDLTGHAIYWCLDTGKGNIISLRVTDTVNQIERR